MNDLENYKAWVEELKALVKEERARNVEYYKLLIQASMVITALGRSMPDKLREVLEMPYNIENTIARHNYQLAVNTTQAIINRDKTIADLQYQLWNAQTTATEYSRSNNKAIGALQEIEKRAHKLLHPYDDMSDND